MEQNQQLPTVQVEAMAAELAALRVIVSILLGNADLRQVRSVAYAALTVRDQESAIKGASLTQDQRALVVQYLTTFVDVTRQYQSLNYRGGLVGLRKWIGSGLMSARRAVFGSSF
jgi:hypothetical protein